MSFSFHKFVKNLASPVVKMNIFSRKLCYKTCYKYSEFIMYFIAFENIAKLINKKKEKKRIMEVPSCIEFQNVVIDAEEIDKVFLICEDLMAKEMAFSFQEIQVKIIGKYDSEIEINKGSRGIRLPLHLIKIMVSFLTEVDEQMTEERMNAVKNGSQVSKNIIQSFFCKSYKI